MPDEMQSPAASEARDAETCDRELAAERALRDGVPSPVELETLRGFVGLVGAQTSERAAAQVRVALRALDRLEKCRAALPPTPTPPEGTTDA